MPAHRKRPKRLAGDPAIGTIIEPARPRHVYAPKARTAVRMTREEMTAAQARAIVRANETGIPLVEALKLEGVI